MQQRPERIQALQEAVRHLESAKTEPALIGDLDFDDARVDGLIATALSAARAALSATMKRAEAIEDASL